MEIKDCIAFTDYLKASQETTDKVAFLTVAFKRLHKDAPEEDFTKLGGRMAQLWVLSHRDTGRLLEIIWTTSARRCNGSHLNFMQAIITRTPKAVSNSNKYKGLD